MKGKLVYTTVVEKEIEIPDEVIAAFDKIAKGWDYDAYTLMEEFSEKAWQNVNNLESRLAIKFKQNDKWWILEEY